MKENDNKIKISINKKNINNIKEKNKENLDKGINILMEYKKFTKEKRSKRIINNTLTNKNRKLINIIYIIILIIIGIIIYKFIDFSPILGIKLYNYNHKDIILDNIDYSNSYINKYNNELLIINNNRIKTFDNKGNIKWEYELKDNFKPKVYIKDEYMIIYNTQNSNVYLFHGYKEILNKKIEGKILDVYMDKYGNFLIEHSLSSYNKKISLYTKNGKLREEITLDNKTIIDIKLLNNAKELAIISADTNSLKINSIISYINLNDKTANIEEIKLLENEIVIKCKTINNELIILTDKRLINFSIGLKTIKEISNFQNEGINLLKTQKEYYSVISNNQNKYKLSTYNYSLENIADIYLENLPKYLEIDKYIIAIASDTNLEIYNKWGKLLLNKDINFAPMNIFLINNSKTLVLVYGSTIEFINL